MKKGIVKILIFLVFFCTRCYFSQAQREPASEPSEHEHPVQEHDHDVHEHDQAAKEVPKRLQQGTIEIKNITGQDINYNVSSDNIN